MKSLPAGNYALCIAHPGHELRLHGFLEQAKPFVWILTDGSHRTGQDMMFDSVKIIDRATRNGRKMKVDDLKNDALKKIFKFSFPNNPEEQIHLKDIQIYEQIIEQHTEFFISYIDFIASNLIKFNVDYLVADASEGTNVIHETNRMLANIAIDIVKQKTGKQILNYDFAIDKPYNEKLTPDCIHIKLDEEAIDRKLKSLLQFSLALTDLKPNISLDYNLIIEMRKMPDGDDQVKQLLKEINIDFLKNEYLRPYIFTEPAEKTPYEINGERAVEAGKYYKAITYKEYLLPIKEKILRSIKIK